MFGIKAFHHFRLQVERTTKRFRHQKPANPIGTVHRYMGPEHLSLHSDFCMRRSSRPQPQIQQENPKPYDIRFNGFDSPSSRSTARKMEGSRPLERGAEIKVITWNLEAFTPGSKVRATAAIDHLMEEIGGLPTRTIIALQEVREQSLSAMLESNWVKRNFKVSNVSPQEDVQDDVVGDSFIMKNLAWSVTPYFTTMPVSNDMPAVAGFRVPFKTPMGRDALLVDVAVQNPNSSRSKADVLRICTTHLESLYTGRRYRLGQLALISALLKGDVPTDYNVVAGLVAGDMNAIDKSEHEYLKMDDVLLEDTWENGPKEDFSMPKPFKKELTNGLARGNTWGYQQPSGKRNGKRLDKILYTGSLESIPLTGVEQLTGAVRRLGVGLRTSIEAYRREFTFTIINRQGKESTKTEVKVFSPEQMEHMRQRGGKDFEDLVPTRMEAWVSDHYGLMAKFRLL